MEDLSRKISELLSDPETMEQIKGLTGLLGQSPPDAPGNTHIPEQKDSPSVPRRDAAGSMPDPNMLGAVMKLAPLLQSMNSEDDSTRLLRALKPFMHEERSKRIDSAIRLLSIMKLLPVLKSSGFDLFK